MLHHVSVGVADVAKAATFYDAALGALGYKRVAEYLPHAIGYGRSSPAFWVQLPFDQATASAGKGVHIGFVAASRVAVRKFHRAALAAGGRDDGAPGPREMYGPDYYGAFVIDLDGNKLEATLSVERKSGRKAATRKTNSKRAVKRKRRRRKARGR
ncbi:MAG: VOC family protein [Alphaproteobacteria bacterium]|nr:VOC family protein [Alphaproteobacteria bacterium]